LGWARGLPPGFPPVPRGFCAAGGERGAPLPLLILTFCALDRVGWFAPFCASARWRGRRPTSQHSRPLLAGSPLAGSEVHGNFNRELAGLGVWRLGTCPYSAHFDTR
jgi:hypothetical protein